jgi:predicted transcriptional regulator
MRTNLIIEEDILKRIDAIAGEKNKRAAVIEKALLEFIEREELKQANNPQPEEMEEKAGSGTKRAQV